MIRTRTAKDDEMIQYLIDQELVPISHLSPQEKQQIRKDLPRRLDRGMTFVSCKPENLKALGFIHILLHGDLLYLDLMAVAAPEQSKRHGKRLLEHAEQYGRLRRCTRAKVMVDEDNYRGIRFYQRHNYQIIRHVNVSRCYEMEKVL